MSKKRELLNKLDVSITIERLCNQLIEHYDFFNKTVIIGVQPRGVLLSKRIINRLIDRKIQVQTGNIDISFYRDDLRRRNNPIVPQEMEMNLTIEGKKVILIDDVLYTGRSIRAALDALMTFGRPSKVELLTLIDRRFSRHLPIEPNYVGKRIDALESERVVVEWQEMHGMDRVFIVNSDL